MIFNPLALKGVGGFCFLSQTAIIMHMYINLYYSIVLAFLGLCLGSFAGASVWRLRALQLKEDKQFGEKIDNKEYKKLSKLIKGTLIKDHSQCLNCSYNLKWYDLIPLISWLSLGGKCRKCKKPIGYFEPVIEIGVALLFVASFILLPHDTGNLLEIIRLIIWFVSGVGLAILFAYDAKWSLLPDSVNYTVVGLGLINSIIVILSSDNVINSMFSVFSAVMILSGLYYVLHKVSKGMWIGFGDVKLGLGLALLVADWRLAFVTLFTANLIGCIIVIPGMLTGKIKRNSHIPFGPLLIIGLVIAKLFGFAIIDSYMSMIL